MVDEVTTGDVTVAAPVTTPAPTPVAGVGARCWWCDQLLAMTDDGQDLMCANPDCEAFAHKGVDWSVEPLCEERTFGGYGRNAVSPPEFCEQRALFGTSHCAAHTYDEQWDEPWDDDGLFLVEGHEHNEYGG